MHRRGRFDSGTSFSPSGLFEKIEQISLCLIIFFSSKSDFLLVSSGSIPLEFIALLSRLPALARLSQAMTISHQVSERAILHS